MALKIKINEEEFKKLPKEIQAEYTKTGDDYELDVDGLEDAAELRRARDREKQTAKDLRNQVKELTAKVNELSDPAKEKDIKKLEDSWKERLENETKATKEENSKLRSKLSEQAIDSFCQSLATKISSAPKIMSRVIRDRVAVEFDDETGDMQLVIRGADGKSSITAERLEKELTSDKDYASILIGSRAKGSGGADQRTSSGGAATPDNQPPQDLSRLGGKELAAVIRARKAASGDAD